MRGFFIATIGRMGLVIEVADATLRNDLNRKRRIYAREGVPEYWVVDGRNALIHKTWSPDCETYAERREVSFGDRITAMAVDGLTIETDRLSRREQRPRGGVIERG
ncbi:Uma2 family endonuclease [Sphingomonas oligophenolica]|uniref:Uma2 family endonuclease n=1 Tax=Sphingomonas oligophenolica TaxID=301154 RepID=A0A502CKS5_9SPHN|nr:Uma2 family endonuclease [Sphingomonas oligophenolica]TPG12719.1 Uma2 family endonuclease [Sphingomonas oligophenolica]